MEVLLHLTYFPNIAQFAPMLQADKVLFEAHGNYEKQTYRNRTDILGPNGKQALSIPVHFTQKKRQLYRDVKISYSEDWQGNHKKSIDAAYKSSPFFEFYEDELLPLFTKKETYLYDFNNRCFETICECLGISFTVEETQMFEKSPKGFLDFRDLVKIKTEIENLKPYTQVFSAKYDFAQNLSILDLLFNEGPNSINYLQAQKIKLIQH